MPVTAALGLLARLAADPNTFTSTLVTILVELYGTEALEWAPETIAMELAEDLQIEVPKINMDKIVVGIALLTTDDFYKRPSRFLQMCNVLSGGELGPAFDKADAAECAWGLTEAMLLAPPEEEDPEPFTREIRSYLGHVVDEEGVQNPPDLLRLAISNQPLGGDLSDLVDPDTEDRVDRSAEIAEAVADNLREMLEELASIGKQDAAELLAKLKQR